MEKQKQFLKNQQGILETEFQPFKEPINMSLITQLVDRLIDPDRNVAGYMFCFLKIDLIKTA